MKEKKLLYMTWSDKEIENTLAGIWKRLLRTEEVGPADNFFDLGGDSVLALRLISVLSDEFGIELSFKVLFRWPTLSRLSQAIGSTLKQTADAADVGKGWAPEGKTGEAFEVVRNGERYFKTSPTQLYWVDDDIDRQYKEYEKKHGTITIEYHLLGCLDIGGLKQAFSFLIRRHESLRSTFHKLGDQYYMKVEKEDSPAYLPEYKEFAEGCSADEVMGFAHFGDQPFDRQKGPLIQVRISKTGEEKYILSIRLHHVIFDALSGDILQRDLLAAFEAFCKGQQPQLPPLKYQFRDYLLFTNRYIANNYVSHRKYWTGLYQHLPPELIIPGAKRSVYSLPQRVLRLEFFSLPENLPEKLTLLAKAFSERMFIVLQTTFKMYLQRITGVGDIMNGTYLFGRDLPDSDNQIGGYAKTVLVRTVFEPQDTFSECLGKVKKANDDMYYYAAFTLLDRMQELLPPGEKMYAKYWKINLQYHQPDNRHVEGLDALKSLEQLNLQLDPAYKETIRQYVFPIDMQINFVNYGDKMEIRVDYDGSTYEPAEIRSLIGDYFTHLHQIVRQVKSMPEELSTTGL